MRSIAACILFLFSSFAYAQVANDKIDNRIELHLDSVPVYSNTYNATVEWGCINRALTNSCLVYHNDQWFYFTPTDSRKQYLNITNQQCKNFKGVQVVIIEGNPCETSTYTLIHCTSFTDQNDTFIELDSLKPGVQYLVLIDGFLGDQCDFEIQFSTRPSGIPVHRDSKDTLSLRLEQDSHLVNLQWGANQSQLDELDHFEIFRQQVNASKAVELAEISISTNALGRHMEYYVYSDSLSEHGLFVYRIIGITKSGNERIILDETQVEFFPVKPAQTIIEHVIQFPVTFSGPVEIVVSDAIKGTALFGTTIKADQNRLVPLDVTHLVNRGYRFFRVKAVHVKSRNVFTQTYALSDDGEWIVVPK
ncbi:MAG: hypothetical protein QY309_15870 [Cyclobacteriaceae bacterium]|nr:MAG: hypothetical protein QY309_15870 [Cyclobacteriaceae bacterium]